MTGPSSFRENPINCIVRHMNRDPGALGADDQRRNLRAVRAGRRVFSAYELGNGTVSGSSPRPTGQPWSKIASRGGVMTRSGGPIATFNNDLLR